MDVLREKGGVGVLVAFLLQCCMVCTGSGCTWAAVLMPGQLRDTHSGDGHALHSRTTCKTCHNHKHTSLRHACMSFMCSVQV